MKELLFPILAMSAAFLVLIPLLSLASAGLLSLRRRYARSWASFGDNLNFVLLSAPVVLPLTWLAAGALHQSEPGQSIASCLLPHADSDLCSDAALLAMFIPLVFLTVGGWKLWNHRAPLHQLVDETSPSYGLLREVQKQVPALLARKIRLVTDGPAPVYTAGLFSPCIYLDAHFMEARDAEEIAAALLHEAAHVRGFDPLRFFALRVFLILNPARRLLEPELQHWRQAREAACDADAVKLGGDPLALAQAILRAARHPSPHAQEVAGLCGCSRQVQALKLRVNLLASYDDTPPGGISRGSMLPLFALAILAFAIPHTGDHPIFYDLHFYVESILRQFGLF